MRFVAATSVVLFTALAAPAALACQFETETRGSVLWSDPPPQSTLKPGESVLRVVFSRRATGNDPGDVNPELYSASNIPPDNDLVIINCGGASVYKVIEVVSGDNPGQNVLVWGTSGDPLRELGSEFLVGRLMPLKSTTRSGAPAAADAPRFIIYPRWPR